MSLYSRLAVPREHPCATCADGDSIVIQFHHGSLVMKSYRIGDAITWGKNDHGSPREGKFGVMGYQEPCKYCKHDIDQMWVIEFEENKIMGIHIPTENDLNTIEW